MCTADEVRDWSRFESLTQIDFLEALALVADLKPLPRASQLAEAGIDALQWAINKASGARPLSCFGRSSQHSIPV